MRPLFTLSARSVAAACALVFGIALFGALVRVLPWLVAREVPFAISAVFIEALTSKGAEMAALVGVPTGAAVAAALLVERGEARALLALGVRPSRVSASVAPLAIGAALALTTVGQSMRSVDAERFATDLVTAGRRACGQAGRTLRVDVPLLSVSWLCFASAPRLVGRVPGLRSSVWFTASELRAGRGGLELDDPRIASPGLGVTLHAQHGRVVGVPGVAGHARGGGGHVLTVTAVASSTAVASVWAIVAGGIGAPLWAVFASGAGALTGAMTLRALEDGNAGWAQTLLAVPAGAVVALVLHAVVGLFLRSHIAGRKAW